MTPSDFREISFIDLVELVPSFISLDISVRSTGWVRWVNGKLDYGTYKITSDDDLGRRQEFRTFLKDLFGDNTYEYLFIEDVIGSINFVTAKILYQLNPIADDMVADGVLKVKNIIREDNKVWKKYLKQCAGYKSSVRARKDDKIVVRECLYALQFGDKTTDVIAEDIYDAMGLAIGLIYKLHVLKQSAKSAHRLRTDITKGYNIKQFVDYSKARIYAAKRGQEIYDVDLLDGVKRDLRYEFKALVEGLRDDSKVFLISVPTSKLGRVALEKNLDLTPEISYLVVYRK